MHIDDIQPFIGIRVDEDGNEVVVPEEEHFFTCQHCGQAVDMRDLGQVFYHDEVPHEPLKIHS